MLKIYHCANARSVRPIWLAEEMGLDYELETMAYPPKLHAPDYARVNPLMSVPSMEDGDIKLIESGAICDYMLERYGPSPLKPAADEAHFPLFAQFFHYAEAGLMPALGVIVQHTFVRPEAERMPSLVDEASDLFKKKLTIVEDALGDNGYLARDRFTAADIMLGYTLSLAELLNQLDAANHPKSAAYWARLKERPACGRALSA